MNPEVPFKYLEDPQKYCSLISNLIEKADDNWQVIWKSAIPELFGSSEYDINSINSLLKVIEKAFKERTYHIRAQAFVCWQFFIEQVEKQSASEKLLNVILIPLSASNHSMKIVLDTKLEAWLTLLNTSILCKSLSRDKGFPSLLKILYGPHTLRTASSYSDLLGMCGKIYRLIVQKCWKNDENNVISSYLEKALSFLSANKDTRSIGREIWIDVIEFISEKRWPITQFSYLFKVLENLLSTNSEPNRIFISDLLPVLICEYNSFPLDHVIPQLNLLTRCLLNSASSGLNLSATLEYLMKKFKKKEKILLDALHETLIQFSANYYEQSQKFWAALVICFCKWNKNEMDSDYYSWILLFPVKFFHEKWNSVIQDDMQKCFESMYSSFKVDTFIKNILCKLKTFLNHSENVPVSLLSAATCLCKIILQKSKHSDDISIIKETLIIIHEKLPSQTSVEGVHNAFISKFLSCVLYFMEYHPDYDSEFKPIVEKYSECIDVEKDSKEYPLAQLISKRINIKLKDDEKLNVIDEISKYEADSVYTGRLTNRSFLARLSPAENKQYNNSSFSARTIVNPELLNESTPKSRKSKTKDDNIEFVAIKSTPKNSPMTEHQKEIAKVKSYIPALYEDLSQSHSDSQSKLPAAEKFVILPAEIPSVEIIDENAVLPSNDVNGDSADEIPASLNFRDAIRSNKSSNMFASKKSLFNENASQIDSNNLLKNTTELNGLKTKTSVQSVEIESETSDTTTVKRSRYLDQAEELTNETCQSKKEFSSASQPTPKIAQRISIRRKNILTSEEKRLKIGDEQNKFHLTTETEFQGFLLSKIKKPPAESSVVTAKVGSEKKSVRRKSLKSKNANATPLRSPIKTRKRKSSTTDGPISLKKSTVLDIDGSCSETDEMTTNVKAEKDENSEKKLKSEEGSESSSSSSVVTVITVETETKNSSELTDSVMIVDDSGTEHVITIDSQSPIAEAKSQDVIPSSRDTTEVVAGEQTTFVESTATEKNLMSSFEEHDQFSNESVKSTQISFSLALTESESLRTSVDETDVRKNVAERQEESTVDVLQETNKELLQITEPSQNSENVDNVIQKLEDMNEVPKQSGDKQSDGNTDHGVSAVEETNTSASPLSANSRTLQMLQMVYSGTPNMNRRQPRLKQNTRSASNVTSPGSNRITVNSVGARVVNLRNMKMLKVNGHVESPAEPTPGKLMSFSEKMEKFKYVPKECTSPSILKKPILNVTISPKSPKSVNFAEQLTDTREYQVDDHNNYTDSWSSNGTQGSDNLLSDDEAISQETLYLSLHNCNDDIRNIAELLTLNKEQMDTLRRMGIETVGQLASANTIVGKSIPVGDNRIQRLRNALKAYDNDRKLKGLRAPSVRRKIMYKSPVEVSSIIEILDDDPDSQPESGLEPALPGLAEESSPIKEETTTDEEIVQPLFEPPISLKKMILSELPSSECESSNEKVISVVGEPHLCSPISMARSQTSPMKNVSVVHLSPPESAKDLSVSSSPIRFTRSLLTSPTKSIVETLPSSPNNTTSRILLPLKGTDSTIRSDRNLESSPRRNLSSELSNRITAANNVDGQFSSPTKEICLSPQKSPIRSVEIISNSPAIEIMHGKSCSVLGVEPETKKEMENTMENKIIGFDSVVQNQDDELNFICTNSEQIVFTNGNSQTHSKLQGGKSMTTLLQTQDYSESIISSLKSSSPEIIILDTNLSISVNIDSMQKDENQESADRIITDSLAEEQQSISIFPSDGTKCVEVTNAESLPTTSEVILMEDGTLAVPSNNEIVMCVDEEPRISEGTESVFYALLQRMLAPYLGPSCLSKWSKESASREEIYKIIRSLDEGLEWIQSAGLMDYETKHFLNQLKYFKASD